MKNKKIAVVGLGYVGLPLAVEAAKKGFEVVGVDIDEEKVVLINEGLVPFGDDELETDLEKNRIRATSDVKDIVGASVIVICVPTPIHENKLPNYGPLEAAVVSVAKVLKKGVLVIIE